MTSAHWTWEPKLLIWLRGTGQDYYLKFAAKVLASSIHLQSWGQVQVEDNLPLALRKQLDCVLVRGSHSALKFNHVLILFSWVSTFAFCFDMRLDDPAFFLMGRAELCRFCGVKSKHIFEATNSVSVFQHSSACLVDFDCKVMADMWTRWGNHVCLEHLASLRL